MPIQRGRGGLTGHACVYKTIMVGTGVSPVQAGMADGDYIGGDVLIPRVRWELCSKVLRKMQDYPADFSPYYSTRRRTDWFLDNLSTYARAEGSGLRRGSQRSTLLCALEENRDKDNGIPDDRGFFDPTSGLLRKIISLALRLPFMKAIPAPAHDNRAEGGQVIPRDTAACIVANVFLCTIPPVDNGRLLGAPVHRGMEALLMIDHRHEELEHFAEAVIKIQAVLAYLNAFLCGPGNDRMKSKPLSLLCMDMSQEAEDAEDGLLTEIQLGSESKESQFGEVIVYSHKTVGEYLLGDHMIGQEEAQMLCHPECIVMTAIGLFSPQSLAYCMDGALPCIRMKGEVTMGTMVPGHRPSGYRCPEWAGTDGGVARRLVFIDCNSKRPVDPHTRSSVYWISSEVDKAYAGFSMLEGGEVHVSAWSGTGGVESDVQMDVVVLWIAACRAQKRLVFHAPVGMGGLQDLHYMSIQLLKERKTWMNLLVQASLLKNILHPDTYNGRNMHSLIGESSGLSERHLVRLMEMKTQLTTDDDGKGTKRVGQEGQQVMFQAGAQAAST